MNKSVGGILISFLFVGFPIPLHAEDKSNYPSHQDHYSDETYYYNPNTDNHDLSFSDHSYDSNAAGQISPIRNASIPHTPVNHISVQQTPVQHNSIQHSNLYNDYDH